MEVGYSAKENMPFEILTVGINRDHIIGETLHHPHGTDHYTLVQMMTPGYISIEGKLRRIEQYECVLHGPHMPRQIKPIDDAHSFRNNWVFFDSTKMGTILAEYNLKMDRIYNPMDARSILECFRMLFIEYTRSDKGGHNVSELIMRQIFIYLSRAGLSDPAVRSISPAYYKQISQIRFEIYNNVANNWKIDELAADLGISTTWFNNLYQSQYDVTPKQDIIRARIKHAKTLLEYSDTTIRNIAYLCGFANEQYFNRLFCSKEGVTPGEYRRGLNKGGF